MYVYHECGYPLLVESVSQGNSFLTDYYDPKIKDHPGKVTCCPHCNQSLGKVSAYEKLQRIQNDPHLNY